VSRRGVTYLKTIDRVLAGIIERVGPYRPRMQREGTHFHALIRAIVYQQLSGSAAATIHRRFAELFGGRLPMPSELLATPDEALRSAGLSRAKTRYLKDLAAWAGRADSALDRVHELADDAVMETLVQVKGIGRWTAHMFLLFRLGRLNVLPELDLGVRKAIQRAYKLRKLPTPKQVLARGAAWAPYASLATWYLWRSLELPPESATMTKRPAARHRPRRATRPLQRRAR
jgi:DNA-3-methyladenine glycosylase II